MSSTRQQTDLIKLSQVFRRELGIWKRLRHSNILKFMGTTQDFGPSVALVAPWIANGTLTSFLQNSDTLEMLDRLRLVRTSNGHTDLNPVVHGDLTGTNVLIDGDRKAYLADFGLSGTLKRLIGMTYLAKMSCRPGAVRWAAPELLSGEEPAVVATTRSDMYSFGSIMLQVLTGNVPWCHMTNETAVLLNVIKGNIQPRPDDVCVTDQHWNFMTCCWSTTCADRPPVEEAVQFVDNATLLISSDEQRRSTSPQISSERHWSMSPQISTLSVSSDERHMNTDTRKTTIVKFPFLFSHLVVRLPAMLDFFSPSNLWEAYVPPPNSPDYSSYHY
ncbi:kinase-like domain-containing protein [Suillus lakei]|nr:kinase-like domain-containing protein [Suillus lakei]